MSLLVWCAAADDGAAAAAVVAVAFFLLLPLVLLLLVVDTAVEAISSFLTNFFGEVFSVGFQLAF